MKVEAERGFCIYLELEPNNEDEDKLLMLTPSVIERLERVCTYYNDNRRCHEILCPVEKEAR